ncbi:MAG TPA: fimbrillin family protein [Bacteroides mediterraneensis]|uniref:fimbrillin family protein n=1 Tax=Bacteroides mediterraneensis TaxID=1841856 RepID=UPI00263887F8|nr:fimbrillin family protein [Bacteroides mediterraneensis]HJH64873.1 fimbrillin family protein [Bacteroides mediterraneensis]
MNIRLPLHILSAATVLLFAATACTQDDLGSGTLPEGEYPLVINATGLQAVATPASTRATVDGDWQGVQTVALKMGDAVKEYTVTPNSADNTKATLSCENDPHYWTSRDPITVSAWWPLDDTDITRMPAVKVAEDQSTLAAYQGSDFISTIDRTVEFNDPKLTFTHRTARVAIELKPGTGFTNVDGATVSLVSLSADNENPTDIKTYHASGNSYEALTAPQTVTAGKPFIRVELGGGNFYFRPQNDVVLEAGNRYTYTVKVNATGLTLAGCEIGKWDDGGGESGAAEDLGYNYDNTTKTYMVYNADGLLAWAEAAKSDLSIDCTLTADIDLTGKKWTPIGKGTTSESGYQGTFDGQGHRITGLAITTDNPQGESAALFGGIGGNGDVKNLQLVDVDYDVRQNGVAGGIAMSNYGTITACSVTGDISATGGYVGGIASSNSGSIIGCWFDGNLTSGLGNGGIAALNYSTITVCFYGGNAGQGATNQGGTVDVTKVDGVTVKWQTAVDGMNPALTGNDYQWALGTDGLPVLQKKQ